MFFIRSFRVSVNRTLHIGVVGADPHFPPKK